MEVGKATAFFAILFWNGLFCMYFFSCACACQTFSLSSPRKNNMAGKSAAKKSADGERRKKPRRSWSRYVLRILKRTQSGKGMTVSSKAMAIVNSFVNDMFDRLAVESGSVARTNKVKTISSGAVQAAVKLTLPGTLSGGWSGSPSTETR